MYFFYFICSSGKAMSQHVTTEAPTSNVLPFSTGRVFAGVNTKG